jgi:hypothetical protein
MDALETQPERLVLASVLRAQLASAGRGGVSWWRSFRQPARCSAVIGRSQRARTVRC